MIPFTSGASLLGQLAEGGAELAADMVADPLGRVKEALGIVLVGVVSRWVPGLVVGLPR